MAFGLWRHTQHTHRRGHPSARAVALGAKQARGCRRGCGAASVGVLARWPTGHGLPARGPCRGFVCGLCGARTAELLFKLALPLLFSLSSSDLPL